MSIFFFLLFLVDLQRGESLNDLDPQVFEFRLCIVFHWNISEITLTSIMNYLNLIFFFIWKGKTFLVHVKRLTSAEKPVFYSLGFWSSIFERFVQCTQNRKIFLKLCAIGFTYNLLTTIKRDMTNTLSLIVLTKTFLLV